MTVIVKIWLGELPLEILVRLAIAFLFITIILLFYVI